MSISDCTLDTFDSILFPPSEPLIETTSEVCSTTTKIAALKIASYLNEPICKVREYFYTFYILNETCKNTAEKIMKAAFLILGIFSYSLLTPIATPVAAVIRCIITTLQTKPYIYIEKSRKGKVLPENREITLVSHNQCYMPAGYSITDGQVMPPSDKARMDANIEKIKKLDPDIVCLYEVPDICDAEYISSQLQEYPFLIPVAGIRTIGPSSMMYIASKYQIVKDSIEFTPFVKGTELTGRAKYSEKGILSFDIKSQQEEAPFASIFSTHLQHSEIPAEPEEEDVKARTAQMHKIMDKIQMKAQDKAVIFTGDLNQEENELHAFLASRQIDWLRRDPSVEGKCTWGGDKWCAELMGKTFSDPLVLDYAFIAGKAASIFTKTIDTGFSGLEFRPEATSDHSLLFSTITVS